MFKRSKVRCIDCGFVGRRWMFDTQGQPTENGMEFRRWGLIEWPAALRTPKALDLNQRSGGLNCEKGVVDMRAEVAAGPGWRQVLDAPRRCEWYEPNADLTFAQHAQSRHARRARRWWTRPPDGLREWVAVGASVIAIVGVVLKLVVAF